MSSGLISQWTRIEPLFGAWDGKAPEAIGLPAGLPAQSRAEGFETKVDSSEEKCIQINRRRTDAKEQLRTFQRK